MWLNYIKIALRNILRNKTLSLINIAGLAIGLATFILLVLYIKYEFSFDRFHKQADNIYRVATEFHGHSHAGMTKLASTRGPVGPTLLKELPEVTSAVRIINSSTIMMLVKNEKYFENDLFFADPGIFQMFTLPLVSGETSSLQKDPFSIVISQELAFKYFGDENPIGQIIRYQGETDLKITAVIENMPHNSHFRMSVVIPIMAYKALTGNDLTNWQRSSCYTYITLQPGTDLDALEKKFVDIIEKYDPKKSPSGHGPRSTLFLQPLEEIHLHSQISGELSVNNDIKKIYLFSSIAFFILLIACFNYMNLTTASSVKRNQEVGIRKTLGAQRSQLIRQFLSESMIITFFALILALLLIELILPSFNAFFNRNLTLFNYNNLDFFLWVLVIVSFVGLFSGSYQAFILSRYKPVKILGNYSPSSRRILKIRSLFVVVQFSISILLIISTLIISKQLDFILSKDVGFKKEQIVTIKVRGEEMRDNLDVIKTQLLNLPGIIDVSSSTYLPNKISDQTHLNWPGKNPGDEITCYVSLVDYNYIDLFKMKLVQGRNFSRQYISDSNGAFIINETAVKALGWENPLEHQLTHWNGVNGNIVGVVKDFNFHSLYRKIEPVYLFLEPNERNYYLSINIAAGQVKNSLALIEDIITGWTLKYPFEYNFFDDIFNKAYQQEIKMEELFKVCALITIFISCLGLFGLALFTTERRTKEIGIRKVLGASETAIAFMLTKEFAGLVLIANLIAWPIGWYFLTQWLQNFAYKTDISYWVFILAGTIALLIALFTISAQSIKAAITNPVESLKYE